MNPINRWMASDIRANATGVVGGFAIFEAFMQWTSCSSVMWGLMITLVIIWMIGCIIWCEVVKPIDKEV